MVKFDFNVKNFKGDNWIDGGKGTEVKQSSQETARELMSRAGLDYEVGKKETFYKSDNGEFIPTGEFATIDLSKDRFIRGGFSEDYTPRSFPQIFEATLGEVYDSLCEQGFTPSNVVSMNKGNGMIMQLRLPSQVTIKDRTHIPYLNLTMGHDGKSGIKPSGGDTCAVCKNTCAIVLSESALMKIIKHSPNIDRNLALLASNIQMVLDGLTLHYKKLDQFAGVKVSSNEVNEFLKVLLPDTFLRDGKTVNASRGNKRVALFNDITTTVKESNASEITIYDLMGGVSRYNTHTSQLTSDGKEKRNDEDQFIYALTTGKRLYESAEELAVKMFVK